MMETKIIKNGLRGKDGALRATLGDVLVLERLRRRKRVVLVEADGQSVTENEDTDYDTAHTAYAG